MGDVREFARSLLHRLIDVGRSLGSGNDDSGNVIMEVEGDPDEIDRQAEDWSHPAIVYKPYISSVPDTEGALKPLLWRAGKELVVIGGREMRWNVSVDAGEVVVRGLAPNSNYVKFKTDGTIQIGGGSGAAAARIGDAVVAGNTPTSGMLTWISAVTSYINGIAPGTCVLPTDFGVIDEGSSAVNIED
jgi:hypothetical protein